MHAPSRVSGFSGHTAMLQQWVSIAPARQCALAKLVRTSQPILQAQQQLERLAVVAALNGVQLARELDEFGVQDFQGCYWHVHHVVPSSCISFTSQDPVAYRLYAEIKVFSGL